MTFPKIDYALLGRAVHHYRLIGYEYVEVPWSVRKDVMLATCPAETMTYMLEAGPDAMPGMHPLVASAEQGFISMDLRPGLYVGVTPCFRVEERHNLLYQPYFMKVELYDNREQLDGLKLFNDAKNFMQSETKARVDSVVTKIGMDLTIDGIEVGSYGGRDVKGYRPWRYGTGLALPRFSVASAVAAHDAI